VEESDNFIIGKDDKFAHRELVQPVLGSTTLLTRLLLCLDSSEMFVFTYQNTRRHIQESYNRATHYPEDIYSHIRIYLISVDFYLINLSFV
jgi:hypothetical protein